MSRVNKSVRTFWARLSTSYYRDPKVLKIGPLGEVAFIRLLALARESVETVEVDGGIPEIVVYRELRDIADLWTKINGPDTGMKDILELLAKYDLITFQEELIIVKSYNKWQTSKEEITEVRAETRARQQARRDRLRAERGEENDEQGDSTGGDNAPSDRIRSKRKTKEAEMGVYDEKVEPFVDLRKTGGISKGKKKVGVHGLDPALAESAEKVVNHLAEVREKKLGGGFRVTDTWWADAQKLLRGTAEAKGLTADQICDLIDFALSDRFWHTHTQTPAGLAKHGVRLYNSDDFVKWSKRNNRPESNRPRNDLTGEDNKPVKGALAADKKIDWDNQSEKL